MEDDVGEATEKDGDHVGEDVEDPLDGPDRKRLNSEIEIKNKYNTIIDMWLLKWISKSGERMWAGMGFTLRTDIIGSV